MARNTSTKRIDDDPNTSICKAQGISIMVQYNELRTATLRSVFAGVYAVSFFINVLCWSKLVELHPFVIFAYCNFYACGQYSA